MTTDVLPQVEEEVTEADGLAHYVRVPALIHGGPVVALCGKKYVPTVLGAEVLDREVCAPCAELYSLLRSMG